MIYDFHTHTFLSDGELSPLELIRRATVKGYQFIAITDHAGPGEMERFVAEVSRDCALAERYWNIRAVAGVELTHLPPESIDEMASQAKEMGARLVVVHGETTVEPVEEGTNAAAVRSHHVDILAHPGLLKEEDAELARENRVFLELSARKGHLTSNEHVAAIARNTGAGLLINSDAHHEDDLLTAELIYKTLQNAGLNEEEVKKVIEANPVALIGRI